jgi:hypothetical protein
LENFWFYTTPAVFSISSLLEGDNIFNFKIGTVAKWGWAIKKFIALTKSAETQTLILNYCVVS